MSFLKHRLILAFVVKSVENNILINLKKKLLFNYWSKLLIRKPNLKIIKVVTFFLQGCQKTLNLGI